MLGKMMKASTLVQLVVCATLAAIVLVVEAAPLRPAGTPLTTISEYGEFENPPLRPIEEVLPAMKRLPVAAPRTTVEVNPVRVGDKFLAVKLPGNGYDREVIDSLKQQEKPFFVQGARDRTWFVHQKDGQYFFVEQSKKTGQVIKEYFKRNPETVVTPALTNGLRKAVTEVTSSAPWWQRLAGRAKSMFSNGIRYLRPA